MTLSQVAEVTYYKDGMRITIMTVVLLCCAAIAAQTSSGSERTFHESDGEQIAAMLLADDGRAPIFGFLETQVGQLGDDAALGVM